MNEKKSLIPDFWLLIFTGETVERLRDIAPGMHSYGLVKKIAKSLLPLRYVKSLEFIGEEAQRLIDSFSDEPFSEKKESQTMDWVAVATVRSYTHRWIGRLEEISKGWILFHPETHLKTNKLQQGSRAFLNSDEFNSIEPLEKENLDEAASSLLINNFTSAEFMALRTAESLLKRWYEKKTGKKLGRTTWGQVLDKLNEEFPEKERPKELHLLDYLRERRNEIAHPEAVSDSVAASTTFLNVISLCKNLLLE